MLTHDVNEFPDLRDGSHFASCAKSATPIRSKAQLLWGTSELIHYKNADGVPL